MLRRAWWHGFAAVKSDEGYEVRLRGLKGGLEYTERDHVLRFGVETATIEADWIIHFRPCRWLPPNQEEEIGDEKCRGIKSRIVAALAFLKIKYTLADS